MFMIKGFIFCYHTGIEANKIFDDLSNSRNKTEIEYNIFQLLNENDVPYPHIIVVSVENQGIENLDNFLCGYNFGDVDIYSLEGRLHEIINMTFIRENLSLSTANLLKRMKT